MKDHWHYYLDHCCDQQHREVHPHHQLSKIDNNVVEIIGLLVVVTVGTGALVVVENCRRLVLNLSEREPGNSF